MGKKAAIRFVPRLWHIEAEGQADCFTQAPERSVISLHKQCMGIDIYRTAKRRYILPYLTLLNAFCTGRISGAIQESRTRELSLSQIKCCYIEVKCKL